MEEDNLVILDVYYIVRDLLHKCICHFSNDEHRFVHFTKPQKNSPISVIHNTTKQEQYFDETIWMCSQCASINLLSDRFCVKCGAPRSF